MIQGPTPSQLLIKNLMLGTRDPKQNDGQALSFSGKDLGDIARVIYAKIPPEKLFADLNEVFDHLSPLDHAKCLENLKLFIKEILKKDVNHEFHDKTVALIEAFAIEHKLPETFIQDIHQTSLALKSQKSRQDEIVSLNLPSGQTDLSTFVARLDQRVNETEIKRTVKDMVSDLRQMQLALFRNLSPSDFHNKKWDKDKDKKLAIGKMIKSFDGLASMVVTDIVNGAKNKEHQMAMFDFYSKVAQECVRTGDFQSAAAIFGALNNSAVSRLKYLMDQPGLPEIHAQLNVVFSPLKANKGLREEIAHKKEAGVSVIPWVGIPMQDMFSTEETPTEPTSEDKLKNLSTAMNTIFDAQSMAFAQLPKPLASTLGERVKQHEAVNTADAKVKEKVVNARSLYIMPRGETQPNPNSFTPLNVGAYINESLSVRPVHFNDRNLQKNAQKLASALTERHGVLMMNIPPEEVKAFAKTPESAVNFRALVNDLQSLEHMVRDDILLASSEVEQKNIYQFYVKVMVECEKNGNYAAMRAIAGGLNNGPVSRLAYLNTGPAFNIFSAYIHHDNGLLSNSGYEGEGKAGRINDAVAEFSAWQARTGINYTGDSVPIQQSDLTERFTRLPLDGSFAAQRSQDILTVNQRPFVNAKSTQAGLVRENEQVILKKLSDVLSSSNKIINVVDQKSTPEKPYWYEDGDVSVVKEAIEATKVLKAATTDVNLKRAADRLIGALEGNLNKLELQRALVLSGPIINEIEKRYDTMVYFASPEIEGLDIQGYKEYRDEFVQLMDKLISVNLKPPPPEISAVINQATVLKNNLDSMIAAVESLPLMKKIESQFETIDYLASADIRVSSIQGYPESRDEFKALFEQLKRENPLPHPRVAEVIAKATQVLNGLESMMSAANSLPLMQKIREEFDGINYLADGLNEQSDITGYKEIRAKFNSLIEKLQSDNPIPHPHVAAFLQEAIAVRDNFDKNVAAVTALQAASPSQPASSPVAQVAAPSQPAFSPATQVDLNDKGKEELYPFPEPSQPASSLVAAAAPSQPASSPDEVQPPETSNLIDEVYDILEKTGEIAKMKVSEKAKIALLVNDIKAHLAPNKVFELIGPQVRANQNGRAFLAFRIDKEPRAQSFCEALRAMNIACTEPKNLTDKGVQVITMDAQQLLAILKDKNGASLLRGNYERIMDEKGAKNLLSPRATQPQPQPKVSSASSPSPLSIASTTPPITLPKASAIQAAVAQKLKEAQSARTTNALDLRGPIPIVGGSYIAVRGERLNGVRQETPKRTAQEIAQTYISHGKAAATPATEPKNPLDIQPGLVADRKKAFQKK